MKRAWLGLWCFLGITAGLWWLADNPDFSRMNGIFAWRNVFSQMSGILAIGVMSLALFLALRPVFLERYFDGLDKMYRLHKWLGISALIWAVTHWLIVKGPKWMVGWGWLERPMRRQRPVFPEGSFRQLLMEQRGLAESVGEWAFYLSLLLMVLALIKYFPYRRFVQTHRFIAVAYLALVFHALVLTKFDYWTSPLGLLLAVLLLTGSVSAMLVLCRRHLGRKTVSGCVSVIERNVAGQVTAIGLQLKAAWPGHAAGQFAFVTLHADEGAHPFTMASSWSADGQLRFLVKALGDYTRTLADRLHLGDSVQVEGPYGCFDFSGERPRQIWIGGGIGITPFMARLQALAGQASGQPIDLFYATAKDEPAMTERLSHAAAAAQVRFHHLRESHEGRLSVARLIEAVPDWRDADIWFCGPARFGQVLREGLMRLGLPARHFHQEMFEMR